MTAKYKLSKKQLLDMAAWGVLETDSALAIIKASGLRQPGKFAKDENMVVIYLDKAKKIWVQNVRFYGGENFGEPYYFVAEIVHKTSNSAFSKFWNSKMPHWIKRNLFFY